MMLISCMAGCGGNETSAANEAKKSANTGNAAVEQKDTITAAVGVEPTTLNPTAACLVYNDNVLRMIFDHLVNLDADGNIVPHLAESYEAVTDTEWKFVLREGVKFHNGDVCTAADVKASILACSSSAQQAHFTTWFENVEVIDDRTLIIKTNAPSARFLVDLVQYCYVMPEELATDPDYNFNEAPIGTGPYKFVSWSLGNEIVLEANEAFYIPEQIPSVKNFVWKIMPEGISRTIALDQGEVDFLYDVNMTDIAQLESNANITVSTDLYSSPFYLCFNLNRPMMDNINLRKAIACAIDREKASLVATNGYSQAIDQAFATNLLGVTNEGAETYDLEKAKEYLAASGLEGQNLSFTVLTKEEPFKVALESIQADLMAIGIDLKIEMLDAGTYTARGADGDFDMITGKSASAELFTYCSSAFMSNGVVNFNFLNDPYMDDLITRGIATIDDEKRAELGAEVCKYVNENCLRTGIYQLSTVRAFNANLQGFETNALGLEDYQNLSWK